MTSRTNIRYVDWSNEKSSVNFRGVDVTAANYDAQQTLIDNLVTAIAGVVVGNHVSTRVQTREVLSAGAAPNEPQAQREKKWLVSMTDANGNPQTVEIPTADLTLLADNSDYLVLTSGVGAALKSAIEAYHISNAGEAVTVNSVKYVGRNL